MSKRNDYSGMRKLISIPFYTYKAIKIKRERTWKSQPSKSNLVIYLCWPLAIPTWLSRATKVQLMQNKFCWIPYSNIYKRSKFHPQTMSYEGDMIFQRWQLNSASKQVSWRNESKLHFEASKSTSKFLYQQFSSSKSELEDFM